MCIYCLFVHFQLTRELGKIKGDKQECMKEEKQRVRKKSRGKLGKENWRRKGFWDKRKTDRLAALRV